MARSKSSFSRLLLAVLMASCVGPRAWASDKGEGPPRDPSVSPSNRSLSSGDPYSPQAQECQPPTSRTGTPPTGGRSPDVTVPLLNLGGRKGSSPPAEVLEAKACVQQLADSLRKTVVFHEPFVWSPYLLAFWEIPQLRDHPIWSVLSAINLLFTNNYEEPEVFHSSCLQSSFSNIKRERSDYLWSIKKSDGYGWELPVLNLEIMSLEDRLDSLLKESRDKSLKSEISKLEDVKKKISSLLKNVESKKEALAEDKAAKGSWTCSSNNLADQAETQPCSTKESAKEVDELASQQSKPLPTGGSV